MQSDVKESKTIQRCVKQGNNNGIVLDSCNTPGAVTIMDGMRVELEDAIAASDRPQSRRAHYFAPHMAMSLRVRGPGVHFDVELCPVWLCYSGRAPGRHGCETGLWYASRLRTRTCRRRPCCTMRSVALSSHPARRRRRRGRRRMRARGAPRRYAAVCK